MEMTKLTIRVPASVLERAKAYADSNQTSVTRLITQYLSQLPPEESDLSDAPITRSLIGILSPDTTIEDYWRYIEEKHGLSRPDRP